ncbi:MAG: glycosyltransferase family 4 protein [Bacteroidetes bacterium]|nr:glycosyltransferase family 4 protein [Bacteroidota bacterium]
MVIDNLPNIRVVHNEFSLQQLSKSIRPSSTTNTFVIPHVNFIHLFKHYQENPSTLDTIKHNKEFANSIHEQLYDDLKKGVKIILFFGQIKNAKGLDTLLRAIAITEGNYKLIVAGRVREGSWAQYEKTINELNIVHKMIPVIRFITDEERDFLFSISTIIVLPYTRIYQSGVLLMAMSFPKAVIASDLSPNSEVVVTNENGMLFQSGNIKQLSEKINVLLNDPVLCETISHSALKSVEKRFNPDIIGERFSEILK